MKLAKDLRALLIIFLEHKTIVTSWGLSNICLEESTLAFDVDGLRFQGRVEIDADESGIYRIKVGESIQRECKLNEVLCLLDDTIEHTDNYLHDVENWISKQWNK